MPRGRPRTPKPGPDAYNSASYATFLSQVDINEADRKILKDDRAELVNAAVEQGLNLKAHAFVQSLRGAVHEGKMTLQDAVATLECVEFYAEWAGLRDQRDMFRADANQLTNNVAQMKHKEQAEAVA